MKTRQLLLFAALAGAAWLAIFGDRTPAASPSVEPPRAIDLRASGGRGAARPDAPPLPTSRAAGGGAEVASLIPRQRLLARSSAAAEAPDLFPPQSWTPPPVKAPPPRTPVSTRAATGAAPLPYTYLGKKFEDGRWEAYLGHGDAVLIVSEGTPLDGGYRVARIEPPTLTLIHEATRRAHPISIEGSPP